MEQCHQIGVGFDLVGFAGFDQRVEIGAGLGTGHGIAEQPVAATHHEGAYSILAEVVVDRPGAVLDKTRQFWPLRRQIMYSLAQQTAGHHRMQML